MIMNLYFILPTVQGDQDSEQYCSELTYVFFSALPGAMMCRPVCLAKQPQICTLEISMQQNNPYHCKFTSTIYWLTFVFILLNFLPKLCCMKCFFT